MGEEQGCWRVRHSSTAMRTKLSWQVGGYRTRLFISLAVLALLLLGCGSDKSQQTTVPTRDPTDAEDHESLKIYGPSGFKVGFGFVRPILDERGLPYENYELYEGPSTSAGIEGLLTGVFDVVTLMRHPLPDEPLMFMEMVQHADWDFRQP